MPPRSAVYEKTYAKMKADRERRNKQAAEWKLILDEEMPEEVERVKQAYFRGRLTLDEARRVLGYPLQIDVLPFELKMEEDDA